MVTIILPDNTLAVQLPQPRIVVTTCRDQIRTIGAERAVPDPALVAVQCRLEGECGGVALSGAGELVAGLQVVRDRGVERPDAGGVVGGTGREVTHVWGEEDAGDVCAMGSELADGDDGGCVVALDHAPDVDVALSRSTR